MFKFLRHPCKVSMALQGAAAPLLGTTGLRDGLSY
jgi:hypothetical protein